MMNTASFVKKAANTSRGQTNIIWFSAHRKGNLQKKMGYLFSYATGTT